MVCFQTDDPKGQRKRNQSLGNKLEEKNKGTKDLGLVGGRPFRLRITGLEEPHGTIRTKGTEFLPGNP